MKITIANCLIVWAGYRKLPEFNKLFCEKKCLSLSKTIIKRKEISAYCNPDEIP